MTPPGLVYLGMGLVIARIMLNGRQTRGLTWLQWLQFLVDAARITLLWPLVLLVEKVETFLKSDEQPGIAVMLFPPDTLEEAHEIEQRGGERQ